MPPKLSYWLVDPPSDPRGDDPPPQTHLGSFSDASDAVHAAGDAILRGDHRQDPGVELRSSTGPFPEELLASFAGLAWQRPDPLDLDRLQTLEEALT